MIQNLYTIGILSEPLLSRICQELEVPDHAQFHLFGATFNPDKAKGLTRNGMVEVELLKFECGHERVNAGYSTETNTLYLANVHSEGGA